MSALKVVYVTGANGFIGSAIVKSLSSTGGIRVIAGVRGLDKRSQLSECVEIDCYGDLSKEIDWSSRLKNVDVLIHTAGFVHRSGSLEASDVASAERLNDQLVAELWNASVSAEIDHFILISTVAVHDTVRPGEQITEASPILPSTVYAKTKYDGETHLLKTSSDLTPQWTILRPVMVYGKNCPGNFRSLVRLVKSRIPLPFRNIHNRRSILHIRNLTDVINLCIKKKNSRGQIFVIADPKPVSTSNIIMWIAEALESKAFLLPFPIYVLRLLANKRGPLNRLGSLLEDFPVDISKARSRLGWNPYFDSRDGILQTLRKDID